MTNSKHDRGDAENGSQTAGLAPDRMEEAFDALVAGLPALDFGQMDALVEATRHFPASGKRLLLAKFVEGDAAEQAVAYCALSGVGQAAADDLNALVFGPSRNDKTKVRADELHTELGSPIDPDVLATSVSDPEAVRAASPWQAARDLAAGEVESAFARLSALDPRTRAVVVHRVARADPARALPLLERACRGDTASEEAVVSALRQCPHEQAVNLLVRLAESPSRAVQKSARRALHSMRTSGFPVPEDVLRSHPAGEVAAADSERGEEKAEELPVHRSVAIFSRDRRLAVVNVARQYPNGRLQVLTAVVDFYKRGVRGARYYLDMSKSRFRRLLAESRPLRAQDLPIEECRRIVARGIRVAREVGTPIPFDLQTGKHVLGDVMAEAAAITEPYVCSACARALPTDVIRKIRDAAPYEQVAVETRCESCRKDVIGL